MAEFYEDFIKSQTGTIEAFNNWTTLNYGEGAQAPGAADAVYIKDNYAARNTGTDANADVRAWQLAVVPETSEVEVGAWVTSDAEQDPLVPDAIPSAEIFCGGYHPGTGTPDPTLNCHYGVSLIFQWLPDGVRRIALRYDTAPSTDQPVGPGVLDATELASVELTRSGGLAVPGYEANLLEGGALGVLQKIRLVVVDDNYGMLAKGYINSDDNDRPTIVARIKTDFIRFGGAPGTRGQCGIGFGKSLNAYDVQIANFAFREYAEANRDTIEIDQRQDQVTFGQLQERVRTRFRASKGNVDDALIEQAILDSTEEIMNFAGDLAWFMRRQEDMDLSPDEKGLVVMPPYVRRVTNIFSDTNSYKIPWKLSHINEDGNLVIYIGQRYRPASTVEFIAHHQAMALEEDPCPLPRAHTELIVAGATRWLAQIDRNTGLEKSMVIRFELLKKEFKRDLTRLGTANRPIMRPRAYRNHRGRYRYRNWWGRYP